MTLSYNQKVALGAINAVLYAAEYDWLPAELMAFIEIESDFNPRAYRFEPRLNDASYGLMQILYRNTAVGELLYKGAPGGLYEPETNVRLGVHLLDKNYDYLTQHLGREPEDYEYIAAYNMGAHGVVLHAQRYPAGEANIPDPGYNERWSTAYNKWSKILPQTNGVNGASG